MAITYLDIVNELLGETNEVPMTFQNFPQARGFQSFVKKTVNRALMDIANASDEWPWLANMPMDVGVSAHSNEVMTKRRQVIYDLADDVREVDWDSFVATDVRGKNPMPLTPISYEEWQRNRNADVLANRDEAPLGCPEVVYKTKDGNGFGLSPVPDKAYRIQYIAWHEPHVLSDAADTLPFPERFYTVLLHRSRYYLWTFRENTQLASMARLDYTDGLDVMKRSLIKPIFNTMRAV